MFTTLIRKETRLLFFIFIACSMSLLSSCHKDDASNEIAVDETSVYAFPGTDIVVPIRSQAESYKATPDDPFIATAKINNNTIVISTQNAGYTVVRVKDNLNRTVEINVYSQTFASVGTGGWKCDSKDDEILIEADDMKDAIRSDILQQIGVNKTFVYSFKGTTYTMISGNGTIQGEYTYTGSSLSLENAGAMKYYTTEGTPYALKLKQDMTQEYRNKFPDAGVTKVIMSRTIRFQRIYG